MNHIELENQINGHNILKYPPSVEDSTDNFEELEIEQTEAEIIEVHEECPSCYEGEHRWIYECLECAFVGCYDEVYENGCYLGSPDERLCPNCNGNKRIRIGKVGNGSVEGYK